MIYTTHIRLGRQVLRTTWSVACSQGRCYQSLDGKKGQPAVVLQTGAAVSLVKSECRFIHVVAASGRLAEEALPSAMVVLPVRTMAHVPQSVLFSQALISERLFGVSPAYKSKVPSWIATRLIAIRRFS